MSNNGGQGTMMARRIAAEIDRLDRAALAADKAEGGGM